MPRAGLEAQGNALLKGANEYLVKAGFDMAKFAEILAKYLSSK